MLDTILISQGALASDDPYDIVLDNINNLNTLFDLRLRPDEVNPLALVSYYVDYYQSRRHEVGFNQFAAEGGADPALLTFIHEGLDKMGAPRNAALLVQSCQLLDAENVDEALLAQFDEQFYALQNEEDLVQLNGKWLKALPVLEVLEDGDLEKRLQDIAEQLPDSAEREAEALAGEPWQLKLIRQLCANAELEFWHLSGVDQQHEIEGKPAEAWHFLTDKGHYCMVSHAGTASLFDVESQSLVAQVECAEGPVH